MEEIPNNHKTKPNIPSPLPHFSVIIKVQNRHYHLSNIKDIQKISSHDRLVPYFALICSDHFKHIDFFGVYSVGHLRSLIGSEIHSKRYSKTFVHFTYYIQVWLRTVKRINHTGHEFPRPLHFSPGATTDNDLSWSICICLSSSLILMMVSLFMSYWNSLSDVSFTEVKS